MQQPTLMVLAAGMGSRYGSLKQMDGVGPNNEAIIDYSVYDAIRAGFGKVVFVIRRDFAEEFSEVFSEKRFSNKIAVKYVFQELGDLPEGFSVPDGRQKPWGTNHAVLAGRNEVKEPFAVINADDFYGRNAFEVVGNYLKGSAASDDYCMVGYRLRNTLSEYGTVSRGVCDVDEQNNLRSLTEYTAIERRDGKIVNLTEGAEREFGENTPVSMNFFGFTPDYFGYSEEYFKKFLEKNSSNLKSEYYIPLMVNELINTGTSTMKVLDTESSWFGVTYKEDKPMVMSRISDLITAGDYPERLWI